MKKFIKYVILFVMPILVFMAALEILVHTVPNSYSYKYNYVKNHGAEIKAVAVGHSQFFNCFKPDLFYLPSFNLSNSSQNYKDDYYVLRELMPYMPNLEMVLLPIGYLNVGFDLGFQQRSCFYHEYMNIDYDKQLPLDCRFECFYVKKSAEKLYSYYFLHDDMLKCDSLGWRYGYLRDRANPLGVNNLINSYTLDDDQEFFLGEEEYFETTVKLLEENDIRIVLVSPPYYWQCYDNTNYNQQRWIKDYIARFCERHPQILYIDYETDTVFEDCDFFDESHLSEIGVVKFMDKLNNDIINVVSQ